MKLIGGDNLIEHAEANGESFEFIRKLIDYISDEPEIKASISQDHENDLISRQSAIDAIKNLPSEHPELDEWCDDCSEYDKERHYCPRFSRIIKTALEDAKLERKKGRWIPHEDDYGEKYGDRCSVCGEWYVMLDGRTNYCPNCGAEMER